MDIIDQAIAMNRHTTDNLNISTKTWDDFKNAIQNKKLILYGITTLTNFLWIRNSNDLSIEAVIDNSREKKGLPLTEFFDEENVKNAKNLEVQSKEILKNYNPKEIVVLISSLKSYEQIARELEEAKIYCYFSVLNLEYNYRKHMKNKHLSFETLDSYQNDYAKKCIKEYPVKSNKIFFFGHGCYSDHEKYITEKLLSINKDLDIVWLMNRKSFDVPKCVRAINPINWKKYVYELETSKIWIFDSAIVPYYMIKREGQIYIQTKHWGSITLKKFFLDATSVNELKDNKEVWELNGKWMDYIISGSEFDEISCRRGFAFNGRFLRFGSPRSDALFEQEKCKKKICKYFNLDYNDHILIYAPTYRFRDGKGENFDLIWQDLNFEVLLESLKKRWPGEWKIFLRLHPSIRNKSKQIDRPEYVIDASYYEDGQEIVSASDVMISDFSSIMFEPAYVLKPVFLYAPDKDKYEKNDYEFLINYKSLPFPISTTNEELSKQIKNFDKNEYKQMLKLFLEKYGVHEDGHASERTANFILKLLS